MRQFKWTKAYDHGKKHPIIWTSDKKQVHRENAFSMTFIKATITNRITGPGTVFAAVTLGVEWASNIHWGFDFNRHFKGPRAWMSARQWCNFLLNNPPHSWREWREEVKMSDPDRKIILAAKYGQLNEILNQRRKILTEIAETRERILQLEKRADELDEQFHRLAIQYDPVNVSIPTTKPDTLKLVTEIMSKLDESPPDLKAQLEKILATAQV